MKLPVKLILFLVLLIGGNIPEAQSFEKLIKDLDGDRKQDTVYLNKTSSRIVCKLSSRKFKPVESLPIEILNSVSGITGTNDGFIFDNHWMRAGYRNYFRYEPETKQIRLVAMNRYEFGNAANDGSGESSVDLLTNEYIGSWNYYDTEQDVLIQMPVIETRMSLPATYLETFSDESYFDYAEQCAQLYHLQKERMQSQTNFGFSTLNLFPSVVSFPETADTAILVKELIDANHFSEKARLSDGSVTYYKKIKLYGSDNDLILTEYDYSGGAMASFPWKFQFLFTSQGKLLAVLDAFRFELSEVFPGQNPLLLSVFSTSKGNGHHALYKLSGDTLENVYDGFSDYFPRTYDAHEDRHLNQPPELNLTIKDVDEDGYNDLIFSGEIIFNQNEISENTEENIHIPVQYVFLYNPETEHFEEQENYSEKYLPLDEGVLPIFKNKNK